MVFQALGRKAKDVYAALGKSRVVQVLAQKARDAYQMAQVIQHTVGQWSEGQMHMPGYEYLGPGTKIVDKMERQVAPINLTDAAAQAHDIDYQNIGDLKLQGDDLRKAVRESDVKVLERWRNDGETGLWGNKLGRFFISAKNKLEDWGVMDPGHFIDRG